MAQPTLTGEVICGWAATDVFCSDDESEMDGYKVIVYRICGNAKNALRCVAFELPARLGVMEPLPAGDRRQNAAPGGMPTGILRGLRFLLS